MFMADKEIRDSYNQMENCGCNPDMKTVSITTNDRMEWWAIRCSRCKKDTGSQVSLKKAVLAWNQDLVH